jgi:CheY-like chemotaxis protein
MPKTLMLIDNDPDDLFIFCEAVKEVSADIECITFHDCIGIAGKTANKKKPDLIFLDLNMPFINGKECLKHIKNNLQLQDIPVVIYSTTRSPKEKDEALQLGASSFLTKPDTFDELVSSLKEILGN